MPQATGVAILGDAFVGALKAIAPLLVFFLLIASVSNERQSQKRIIRKVLVLYLLCTFSAALVGVLASKLFPITLTLTVPAAHMAAPEGIAQVLRTLFSNMVANPIHSLANGNYIGILIWGILIGVALRNANDHTKKVLNDISSGLSKVVTWIIKLAPFGIMGLVFSSVSESGLEIFSEYGRLLLVLVGSMLFVYFVVNPIFVFWCIRQNPYPLIIKCIKKSAVTAFFTRSSAANIPVNMKACEEFGLDKDTYSVTIPLGATINMDGAAVTITVMSLAAVHTLGIQIDILSALVLGILATVAACGASGVAGGSLLLIPMACSLFGIPNEVAMQVVGIDLSSASCKIPLKPHSILPRIYCFRQAQNFGNGAASEKKLNSKKIAKNASLKTLRFGGAFFCLCKRYSRKRKAPKVVCNFRGRFFLQCFDFVN